MQPTRGAMSISDAVDQFLVRHMEGHAARLAE
jgi:hypothetical protein